MFLYEIFVSLVSVTEVISTVFFLSNNQQSVYVVSIPYFDDFAKKVH